MGQVAERSLMDERDPKVIRWTTWPLMRRYLAPNGGELRRAHAREHSVMFGFQL
jgi:hypothetical protein